MNKFREWYLTYWLEITWFLMGWLTLSCIDSLIRGHYLNALVDAVLIFVNYSLSRR